MPFVTDVFKPLPAGGLGPAPVSFGPVLPVETTRRLQAELSALGMPVADGEADGAPRFGSATADRLKQFQQLYGLPVDGALNPTTGGVLTLAAMVAAETDHARLRTELRAAQGQVPNSPQYNYWLARYAILAGDYDLAAGVLKTSGQAHGDLGRILGLPADGIFIFPVPEAPEVPFPENFYSYRRDLYPLDMLNDLQHQVQSVGQPPRDPNQASMGDTGPDSGRGGVLIAAASSWFEALKQWQIGNAAFDHQRYTAAQSGYDACQSAALDYFTRYYEIDAGSGTLEERIGAVVNYLAGHQDWWQFLWAKMRWRQSLLSLNELQNWDWPAQPPQLTYPRVGDPNPFPPGTQWFLPPRETDFGLGFIQHYLQRGEFDPPERAAPRQNDLETPLFVIAFILVPLARGEVNRARRQYAAAIQDFLEKRLVTVPPFFMFADRPFICSFIEGPFARLLAAETLMDQAEAQFKARLSIDDEVDAAKKGISLSRIDAMAQEYTGRQIPRDGDASAPPFQHLVAALTYSDIITVLQAEGEYVARSKQGVDALVHNIGSTVAAGDVRSLAFRSLGQAVTVPTVQPLAATGTGVAGLTPGTHPHEPYLQFSLPDGQQAMREWNPRVYALLLTAQARLLQIWSGFNYLGYRDDYVPPWRFQFLLERARYFSEHAKNAQRDYLNFLNNGETEELKELSASQTVELEKASVQLETARVDLATSEIAAAKSAADGAALHAQHAADAAAEYADFEQQANEADAVSDIGSIFGDLVKIGESAVEGNPFGVIAGGLGLAGTVEQGSVKQAQRAFERRNYERSAAEATAAAADALRKLDVARSGFVAAGLQRQAALLRHEFALQSLQFLRNRELNAEQWYRLAVTIRSIGDTYLRYAIETAFLAQQSYNFEVDKRLGVIRFDYDLSDVGAMLAADFLLRDLDTLEQDLITGQRTRQQQIRYVLSLAREFPETLRVLSEAGSTTFSLRLEQIERHFPGLVSLRVSGVELQPVALMDPTRVSVALTHLGSGMVRLKSQPGASPLNTTDLQGGDWLPNAEQDWPVKINVSGPEIALFSGLSRQEASSLSMIAANERAAFDGVPGASNWRIDLSMQENQVVPGTLADVLITFTLSGYYDPQLRAAIDHAQAPSLATTSFISARRALPDAYYSLVHTGKLAWDVPARMLTLTGTPDALRNLAVTLPLNPQGVELGRCYCRYPVEIDIAADGTMNILTTFPQFTLISNALTLNGTFTGSNDTVVTWDFGDGSALVEGRDVQHAYNRPGRYEVLIRLVRAGRLSEYRAAVYVSQNHAVAPPLIAVPAIAPVTPLPASGPIDLSVTLATAMADVAIDCAVGNVRAFATSGPAILEGIARGTPGKPNRVVLDFLVTRNLSARLYSKQRFLPAEAVAMSRLRVATNRTFAVDGESETTTAPNAFTKHLFGDGPAENVISPADRWTFELPDAENPWFVGVSSSDVAEFDGRELDDATLSLEYLAPPS
jgi:peptidoglycan hydrolase-like protein with peptidoglycan-binding domain